MSNARQFLVIGALVVVSGLGAVVTVNSAINGAIGSMDEKTSQTGSEEAQDVLVIPSSSFVTTETTPAEVLQNATVIDGQTPADEDVTSDMPENPSTTTAPAIQPGGMTPPPERHYESHTSEVNFN